MTPEQIDKLTPEQVDKLDGLWLCIAVAVHIFGWRWVHEDEEQPDAVPYLVGPEPEGDHEVAIVGTFYPTVYDKFKKGESDPLHYQGLPPYAHKIESAWKVVEKVLTLGHAWRMSMCNGFSFPQSDVPGEGGCIAEIRKYSDTYRIGLGRANDITTAICRAALKAVMKK